MYADIDRQKLIPGLATEGFWDWNLKTNIIYLSPRYCELTGCIPEDPWFDKGFVDMLTLPDDHQKFFLSISKHLQGKTDVSILDYKMILSDGSALWIESRCRIAELDENKRISRIVGTVANITERNQAGQELHKLNRALLTISACNQALLHADNEAELLQDICRIVVETGGYRMAWVGYAEDDDEKSVRPVAQAGNAKDYLETLNISWADIERGQGPTGRAIRTGKACSTRNMLTDQSFLPWRMSAIQCGYASAQSLPLISDHKVFGALNIYSGLEDAFNVEETELLSSLAENLAYGITMLKTRKAHELAEEKLRQSEARYRSLFQNKHTVMLIIDPADGAIVDANPAAVTFYGWKYDELCNMNIAGINTMSDREIKAEMQRSLNRKCNCFGFRHRLADGSIRDVEVVSGPISIEEKQLLYSIVNDITERKQFQELLLESNERMHFIMAATNAGFWEHDIASNVQIWSDELWPLYGLELHSCTPSYENWLKTVIPEERETIERSARKAIDSGSEFNCMWRVSDADGRERWLMSKGTPQKDSDGRLLRHVGIVIDITDRKKEEENKQQLESSLRKSQRLETIGTLAGGIAHDFNNILMPILGYAEMGVNSIENKNPLHDCFLEIMLAAERARNLVAQILTFSRTQESEPSVVSVQSVIAEALKLLRPSIPATITIEQQIDNNCRNILADPSQIHQVIVNLCTNAFHAMEISGGVMTLMLREMLPDADMLKTLPGLPARWYVQLSVTDTGTGMDEATMERIFEPFFTTKSVNKGTGLGLSVVHGIIKSYKGAITVDSRPEKGTSFRIYLPVIDKPVPDAAIKGTATAGNGSILFVDDEKATIKMMTMMLSRLGYQICAFCSPREALERFRQRPDHFDLVITDLTMPEMNGITLAAELHKTRPYLPVILMTGYGKNLGYDTLNQSGICKLLKKPLKMTELSAAIKEVISGRNS
ncbi:PAS domain S-box protein [Chlorobium limicola]|uniref:histidine kinase n=1 Tax=Chlorobium limicola TaxID=1092 RepID=A0A101JGW1_CHLLI|nr:PAS domain S-box protein [Chlorobium limicola]KUL26581.1 hypothetical protein ASB62_06405 [Chlorobium limicola]